MTPGKTIALPRFTAEELEAARLPIEAERLATAIVASLLRGLFADQRDECLPAESFSTLRPSHRRWVDATLRHLEKHGLVGTDAATGRCRFAPAEPADALWRRWDAAMGEWRGNPNHHAYLGLIETCLRQLPEILVDAVPATDVMFPESSMRLVEGIYKHNLVADHFNHVLGETLRSELAAKTARHQRGVRLLEIGAGTGGTTAALLPMLRGFGELIEEYCYTDLSKAFLQHAEDVYGPQLPALRTAIFDVGKPLAPQSIDGNRYDAVIATNVLHATPDMRETLRNAKAALKRGGILLVNEISDWSWHTHFTFGLLEGWWLYEDEKLRLPGSPGLSPAQWENLLRIERFFDIRFPAREHHGLGQQIVAARSDGVVRQRRIPSAAPTKVSAPAVAPVVSSPPPRAPAAPAATTDDAALREASSALFRETIAAALRMDMREIEGHKPLEHYGLDSILVVQLTTRFRKLFPGVRSTLFFEVQSIDGLVQHFMANDRATLLSVLAARGADHAEPAPALGRPSAPAAAAREPGGRVERRRFAPRKDRRGPLPTRTAGASSASSSSSAPAGRPSTAFDVAIIGVSGRYPQAPDLDRFWENLSSGRSCATEIPAERWHWRDFYDPEKGIAGKSYTKWGGFLEDVDKFDPLFFRIAPKEAKRIDPQERLFLETSYHAIEDSGHTPATLAANGRVGVFVGVMNSRYTVQPLYYSIANRVSFLFDFRGPSFAVDSACSSSLTAIHLALDSLYSGMCDAAIAGGVSLILDPQHMLELTAVGMLSEGAQCRSFGRNADGFVDAEGVGAVILKPLSQAVRDGDNIYAVIKGSALNAGGRTHGYSVPNPVAQADVVSAALARANVDPAEVSYLEAHGTGTSLGDPIEVAGLTRAFRSGRRAGTEGSGGRQFCAIGSLKSNIGHCESAAGIAALTKVLMQLKHGQLVPTLHVDEVNDEIDFSATPFRLQRELTPWRRIVVGEAPQAREIPRIAGISSFGAGGANAHLVVQEPPTSASGSAARSPAEPGRVSSVPLSARTPEQLQDKIRQLLAFLERKGADVELHELAYTLQVGREAMDERIAFVADSVDDLRRQLLAVAGGQRLDPDPPRGSVRKNKEFLAACRADPEFAQRCEAWTVQRDHARIAEHWVKGVDIDWSRLYPEAQPRRISLPAYPFARERHWIEPQRSRGHGQVATATHPLLQRNTSTLRYPAYSVELKGDERFLDEDSAGRRRVPALLCVEMARAAIAASYPDDVASRDLSLENFVCDDAILVEPGCELHIALLHESEEALRVEIFSTRDGAERVHCQGGALLTAPVQPVHADVTAMIARLSRGIAADTFYRRLAALGQADRAGRRVVTRVARAERELVLEFSAAASSEAPWGLQPDVLAFLNQGAAWLLDDLGQAPAEPFECRSRSLDTVQLWAQSDRPAYLVLRCKEPTAAPAAASSWEAELYDALGKPCLRASGLRLECVRSQSDTDTDAVATAADPFAAEVSAAGTAEAPVLFGTRRKIAFLPAARSEFRPSSIPSKPSAVLLSAAGELEGVAKHVGRSTIALQQPDSDTDAGSDTNLQPSPVELYELGGGVFSIVVAQATLERPVVAQLLRALEFLRQRPDTKALLISGSEDDFLHGDRQSLDHAIAAGLYSALIGFPLPTVAVMRGGATGAGFLLGATCDFMVCSRESRYAFSDPLHGLCPTAAEAGFLAARFGRAWADDLLYVSGALGGSEMAARGWTFPVVECAEAMPTAVALAKSMAEKPRQALCLLKQHMADALRPHVERFVADCPSRPDAAGTPQAPPSVELPHGHEGIAVANLSDSVVSVRVCDIDGTKPSILLGNLRSTLAGLAQRGGCAAAVVLRSDHPEFLPIIDDEAEAELVSLQAVLSDFPVPVIVAFERDAGGAAWLLGLSADACVYGERGRYSADALWRHPLLLPQAAPVFASRLGTSLAKRVLFEADAIAGAELASGAGTVPRGDAADVLSKALALAESCPLRSAALLGQWRARNSSRSAGEDAGSAGGPGRPSSDIERHVPPPPLPTSSVIETEVQDNGVVVVRMVDRGAKNMFSPELIRGLEDVFAHIDASDAYRAVVLCGYDTYFACGGTRESLLAIQQGSAKFTDAKIYQLPMSCRLPVIAAMQGHAIGGGWALGMFADICLFSAESRYISPYMQYGFTPGAGSTLIFPATLGLDLAKETLFTAAEHTGDELRSKGLPHSCHRRSEVMSRALALANTIATRRIDDVRAVKRFFSGPCLATLEDTYTRELAMHEKSFVGQSHALQGVMRHFLDDGESAPVPAAGNADIAPGPVAAAASQEAIASSEIAQDLKSLLAAELQMSVDDVDEDMQFVDLGLDSITGVTWIRKVNGKYGIRIEATKVYSHPTLRQFCDFLAEHLAAERGEDARVRVPAGADAPPAAPVPEAAAPAADADADLCVELKRLLAQELHMPEAEVDEHRQFVELGLDSITGVTWVRKINAAYGTRIEATKVYSHPTLVEFSRFVAGSLPSRSGARSELARTSPPPVPTGPATVMPAMAQALRPGAPPSKRLASWRAEASRRRRPSGPGTDAIAVIGMSGQFPHAKNLGEFWRNIAGAKDCIDTVPPQRWDVERYFNEDISVPGTTNSRWMGVLEDCDAFDPLFFNISPTEAESMDPQQRLMLQGCWHAIENAAIDPRGLSGSRCGVFIGCGATDYHQRSREHQYSTQGFTGASMSILAARISYFLNLQGPCVSIDTACSSSLVAIANACDSLVANNCDAALAGGVAVMAGPTMHVKTGQSGMLSVDGRCFAFDHRANGFVPAEGVGAVMLKRLADAERDGDIIHAVIRGWGVNQDGKTNGITAPNPVSQTRLMRGIYDKFGVDPEDIQLVEAHGTGTKLGDPIEVEGLTQAFRHYTRKTQYCGLGSVKSGIGHCLYAAGIAGVLKLVLAMKHRQLPPAPNFERLNPHIDLHDSPFVVNTELKPWPANAKGSRSSVISSFGFSGTNVHLVLEATERNRPEAGQDAGPSRPMVIPLSAKTGEQLRQRAQDLADFIADADVAPSLRDIAYTLQVGREAMEERCALVVESSRDLEDALRAFVAGRVPRGMYVGSSLSRASKLAFIGQDGDLQAVLIDACLREGKLEKLAELWIDGVELPWEKLHRDAGHRPRRIELPLYPFAKERYWLEEDATAAPGAETSAAIHPLLHVNASTLQQQRYRTTFRGSEFFLRDHRVRLGDGRVEQVLPGVAYLEMAAAAVADALPERAASERLVLTNVAWWRPVVVGGPTAVEIELGVDDSGAIVFEVSSGEGEGRVLHCQGEAEFSAETGDRKADAALLDSARNGESWSADDVYAAFEQVGLHYGPAHRGIRKLSRAEGKVVATVALPSLLDDGGAYRLHPSLMDSALQACIGFLPSLQALPQEPAVPFALGSLTIRAPCPPEIVVVLTPTAGTMGGTSVESCDVSIFGQDGTLCVELRGFTWRAVDKTRSASSAVPHDAGASDEMRMFDEAFYQELLDSISRKEMSAEEAAELGLLS